MFVTPGWFPTVEWRGKASQQMCYTGLQHQHRDRGTDRDHTPVHVFSSTARPQYSPIDETQWKFSTTTWRRRYEAQGAVICYRLHNTTSLTDVAYKTYGWNANMYRCRHTGTSVYTQAARRVFIRKACWRIIKNTELKSTQWNKVLLLISTKKANK
jgi:hypothetical protein